MNELIANNAVPKPVIRCDECDTETDHYVTFVLPSNEIHNVCWSCQERNDKFFFTKRGWHRSPRQKQIELITEE